MVECHFYSLYFRDRRLEISVLIVFMLQQALKREVAVVHTVDPR
jgi:hypothetical protein